MPEGRGTHVLSTGGKRPIYYDTVRTGGVGGKANTKQGGCNVEFNPGMKMVATREIEPGDEIFADYGPEYRWEEYDGEREGWTYVRRKRKKGGRQPDEGRRIGGGKGSARSQKGKGAEKMVRGRQKTEAEDSWKWVRPAIMRKGWRIGEGGGYGSEEEETEGVTIGGDRGGEVDDEAGSDEGGDERNGNGGGQGRGNAKEGEKRGRGGRIITRAPMGLRLRWMIEGKGPPWAQR